MVTTPETVPLGAVIATVGAVVSPELATVMATGADVAVLPAASRAMAVRVWAPLATVVVLKVTL